LASGTSSCSVVGGCAAMTTGVPRNQSSRKRCSVASGVVGGAPGVPGRGAVLGSLPGAPGAPGAGALNTPGRSGSAGSVLAQAATINAVHTANGNRVRRIGESGLEELLYGAER
jgi:hypothetical protein